MRLVALIGLGLLAGCTTSASMPKASLEQQQEALAFQAQAGMSRVYVLNGLQRTLLFDRDHHTPGDYFINGQQVCSLNAAEYFVVDLLPGNYSIMWRQRTSDPLASKGSPTSLSLHPDEVVFLRSVEDVRILQKSALLGGAIGVLASSSFDNPLVFETCAEQCPDLIPTKTMVVADAQAIAHLSVSPTVAILNKSVPSE